MSSGQAAQSLSALAQVASSSANPARSSSGEQKGSLGSSRGPRGPGSQLRVTQSPPAKPSALRQVSSFSSKTLSKRNAALPGSDQAPLDLTSSKPSTPTKRSLKSYLDRSLLQGRPRIHTPVSSGPRTKSPSKVTDIDAARSIPNQFSWDGTRADVREFMVGGLSFWDAVAEAGKTQALHHRFGLKALVYMLMSAIYWEALDLTPWIRYVPINFLETALGRVKDVPLAQIPERWKPLPVQQSSGNDGQVGFQDYYPSDFAEVTQTTMMMTRLTNLGLQKARVQSRHAPDNLLSATKRLCQTVYGKGLRSKKGKRDFQFPDETKDLPDKFKLPAMTAADTYAETPSN
ncbi:hypothetical protein PHYPSEUDO_003994 [Phytophthora pseudosyringae]|uniref:Uncharacterized protein n=1 Tax=Phytophthora pseudosyringae TaxID=221518 RepID=A0A8T1VP78_9STRA|nr:hypothetical protein PHYPSEUDO_003994 [Phytophthora pseudosyringae]